MKRVTSKRAISWEERVSQTSSGIWVKKMTGVQSKALPLVKKSSRPIKPLPRTHANTSGTPGPDDDWQDEGPLLNLFDPTPLKAFQEILDADSKVCILEHNQA
jgi:hypothetical protein